MYNNLIEEDIMILDNEFFKIDTMFESVDKMYDIKQRELEYNYIYTENVDIEFVDLYTEAEEAKSKNEQGLLGRLFTAILNFIRKIRAKILRFFGNDKKAAELEAKIKGNPKLANQTVEITNTTDAEKAIDEGTSFFGSLIDKIIGGKATEKDADDAEEKNKSLLSRIGIFGGGALLAAGGAKVASDKLKERGVTKQTIKENVSNLFKREEDTKKKSNEVTQKNEQNVQKAQQAMNNNSQSGNEENTKAGRRIVASFKDFITGAGKFFTGKASELKSKINGVSSNNNDDNTGDNKGSSISSGKSNNIEGKYDAIEQCLAKNDVEGLRNVIGSLCYTSMDFSSGEFDAAIKYVESKGIKLKESYNGKPELILNKKDLSECTEDDFGDVVFELKENFCTERINEVKKIGKYVYGPGGKAKNNDDKKKDSTKDDTSEKKDNKNNEVNKKQEQVKTKSDKPEETESNDKKKLIDDDLNTALKCKHIIREIKIYDSTNHVLTKDEMQKINEIDKKATNKKCTRDDLIMVQKMNEDMKKRTPGTSTTNTTEQKNGKNDKTKPETKSDNQDHELSPEEKMDYEIRCLLDKFSNRIYRDEDGEFPITFEFRKEEIKKGYSIFSLEDLSKIDFSTSYDNKESHSIVERAKIFLDSYKIYSKYKNPDKNKVKEALKNRFSIDYEDDFLDEEMKCIKKIFTILDKYAKELNELIKKRETFKESSYDLINDILTILENSF